MMLIDDIEYDFVTGQPITPGTASPAPVQTARPLHPATQAPAADPPTAVLPAPHARRAPKPPAPRPAAAPPSGPIGPEPPPPEPVDDSRARSQARERGKDGKESAIRPLPLVWLKDAQPVLEPGGSLVEGLLDAGAMSVAFGPSNSGKSFWCLDLALHIAAGIPWRGRAIPSPGLAVHVASEGGTKFVNRLVAAAKQHHDVADAPLAVMPARINLLVPDADIPSLLAALRDAELASGRPLRLIVVDTLARAMAGGDENSAVDMTAFVSNIDALREATGAHVQVVHHSGKDQTKGSRGHSSLRAACDTEIEVTRTGAEGTKEAAAIVRKQRDLQGDEVFPFTLAEVEVGRTRAGQPVTSAVVEQMAESAAVPRHKLSANESKAFRFLADVLAVEGRPLPGIGGFPSVPDLAGAPLERWRAECEARSLSGAEAPKVRGQAFRRAFEGLATAGRVASRDGIVWICRP